MQRTFILRAVARTALKKLSAPDVAGEVRIVTTRSVKTSAVSSSLSRILRFLLVERRQAGIPSRSPDLEEALPVEKPNFATLCIPTVNGIRVTWIGHSSLLVQLEGLSVLTDPMFSRRCSPVPFVGPKRYRPIPCNISDLPHIDAVLISHNHYDHLDARSVRELNTRFGECLAWLVPVGLKQWLLDRGCEHVHELSWWEERGLLFSRNQSTEAPVIFGCVPAQHFSGRGLFDAGKSLWCGWVVIGRRHRFYFAGDTGYCDAFRHIGNRYGPFDLAAIPIGAYDPRDIMAKVHVDPAEAVLIHQQVGARWSIGIHWGTFPLSAEPYLEPPRLVKQHMTAMGEDPTRFFTLRHGGTRLIATE